MPSGNSFSQALGAFVQQGFERDAVDQVHWVQHVAFGFAHLLALRVEHQAVDVDVFEGHFAGEVRGHHDHPGDPEEDDVVAGDQHRGGQVEVVVLCSAGDRTGDGLAHTRFARQIAASASGTLASCVAAPTQR
jgi:hypothetical protein